MGKNGSELLMCYDCKKSKNVSMSYKFLLSKYVFVYKRSGKLVSSIITLRITYKVGVLGIYFFYFNLVGSVRNL